MTIDVDAPCNSNYLEGPIEQRQVSLYIDKVVVLTVAFQLDDENKSWEIVCGSIERVFIYDAPVFVKYNEHRRTITIKPE